MNKYTPRTFFEKYEGRQIVIDYYDYSAATIAGYSLTSEDIILTAPKLKDGFTEEDVFKGGDHIAPKYLGIEHEFVCLPLVLIEILITKEGEMREVFEKYKYQMVEVDGQMGVVAGYCNTSLIAAVPHETKNSWDETWRESGDFIDPIYLRKDYKFRYVDPLQVVSYNNNLKVRLYTFEELQKRINVNVVLGKDLCFDSIVRIDKSSYRKIDQSMFKNLGKEIILTRKHPKDVAFLGPDGKYYEPWMYTLLV